MLSYFMNFQYDINSMVLKLIMNVTLVPEKKAYDPWPKLIMLIGGVRLYLPYLPYLPYLLTLLTLLNLLTLLTLLILLTYNLSFSRLKQLQFLVNISVFNISTYAPGTIVW